MPPRHPCEGHIRSCPPVQRAGEQTAEQIEADVARYKAAVARDASAVATNSLGDLMHADQQRRLLADAARPALPSALDIVLSDQHITDTDHHHQEEDHEPARRQNS